ncbi:hypothetical protein PLICRDRAFT_39064 [Plicaturopsis crispa FD-325 SS-3]|nr:hypothetical protein PLICRDRAFT_39064 [Plicaturopsis crispa FD-325 SS-3]
MDRGASNDEVWRIVQSSEDELRLLKAHEDDYYPPAPSQYNVAQESGQQYRPMCPLPSRSLSSYPPAEPAYEYGWEEENQSDEEDDFQDQQLYENDRQFGR